MIEGGRKEKHDMEKGTQGEKQENGPVVTAMKTKKGEAGLRDPVPAGQMNSLGCRRELMEGGWHRPG